MASERPPDAFLSYTRFDDQHDGGAISEFRERLASAVRAVSGVPFEIFQDVDGIGLGERWLQKLDEVLAEARFFVPILTPSYFKSNACREELEKFLKLERDKGRVDLVLPVYYIKCEVLDEAAARATDPLARAIHQRQIHDWRLFRYKSFRGREVKEPLDKLAEQVAKARRRYKPPDMPPKPELLEKVADYIQAPEQMNLVPAGSFLMGSPDGSIEGDQSERPEHEVHILRSFEVGCYPVTFDEYDDFARRNKRVLPKNEGWERGRRPVINVSWDDAKRYCRWKTEQTGKNYRLLSEAEWEYCCRAGESTSYSCGDSISCWQANYGNIRGGTTEVGSYPPNAWGLYDMHGNVWEWVEDSWHDSYDGAPGDGSPWVDKGASERVVRGGGWGEGAEDLRAAVRQPHEATLKTADTGFRVARDLDQTENRSQVAGNNGVCDEQEGSN